MARELSVQQELQKNLPGLSGQVHPEMSVEAKRSNRYYLPLHRSGLKLSIPDEWNEIPYVDESLHDPVFIKILRDHGLPVRSKVPLVSRYSKGSRWSREEFEECLAAWKRSLPITHISAAVNRNPQDIIFRLMDHCRTNAIPFSQSGLQGSARRWTDSVRAVSAELFENGLTAWRIAVLFHVDFELVEKTLFKSRDGYGHVKKNPFAICTTHKRLANEQILRSNPQDLQNVLDAYSGFGEFASIVSSVCPDAEITSIERDSDTFRIASERRFTPNHQWRHSDCASVMKQLLANGEKFTCIDLDPFVTCHEEIPLALKLLDQNSLLCITLGGEYRRSFIGSNRKAILRRYGFNGGAMDNTQYLENMPHYFLGHVAMVAAGENVEFEVLKSVRYANCCRFWLRCHRESKEQVRVWCEQQVDQDEHGNRWKLLRLPKFAEIRSEFAETAVTKHHPKRIDAVLEGINAPDNI